MIEKHIYQCEVCGKDFNDRDDCREHEMGHTVSRIKNAVVMMDDDREILSLDDMHTAIERSYAIYVGCRDAANILWELFNDEGCNTPIEDIEASIQYPAFFLWDQNNYRWRYMRDLEEKYNRLLELKITAENALLS